MDAEPLSIGVLTDGALRRWQIEALEQMVDVGAQIELIIVNGGEKSRIRYNLCRSPAYLLLAGSRELSVRLLGSHPYLKSISVSEVELLEGTEQVRCMPIQCSDFGQKLPQSVVNEYCRDLDVLVRFGFGIVRGDVLDAPEYGVLSYHHGDIRKYRGRPAGFWEFMHDEDTIGVTLQQLTDELDRGRVVQIKEFEIEENNTYQDILQTAYLGSIDMLAEAIVLIHKGEYDPTSLDNVGELYTAPAWSTSVNYFLKNTLRRSYNQYHTITEGRRNVKE